MTLGETAARSLIGAALLVVAALITLTGLGWFTAALYLALSETLPPSLTALCTGFAVLAAGGIVGLIARRFFRRDSRRDRNSESPSLDSGGTPADSELAAALGQASALLIGRHGKSAALMAFASGFVFGVNPGVRRGVLNGLFHVLR
jgi:hypothetical protein